MQFNTVTTYYPSTSMGSSYYPYFREEKESTSLLDMFVSDVQRLLEYFVKTIPERKLLIGLKDAVDPIAISDIITSNTEVDLIDSEVFSQMQINEIEHLRDNWNDNGAVGFSSALIQKTRKIVKELPVEPFVSPTACGAIQIEYEKTNGEYLEFDIYENYITMFMIDEFEHESEGMIDNIESIEKMKRVVKAFYECDKY